MSPCSVATGLLAAVAVFHILLTVVLTALVIFVCKKPARPVKVCPACAVNPIVTAADEEATGRATACTQLETEDQNSPNEKDEIRPGRTSTPRLTKSGDSFEKVDLSTLQRLDSEIYDNQGTSDWDGEESELELSGRLKNKTIEELRRDSVSSIKKPSSPLRRISSPLTRSGRFSIVSITSRRSHNKSVDLGSEGVSLIMSPDNRESSESSSSPLHASPKLAVDSADADPHGGLEVRMEIGDGDDITGESPPPILILQTSPDHATGPEHESQC